MSNDKKPLKIYIEKSIDELPKEEAIYAVVRHDDNIYFLTWTGTKPCEWLWKEQVKFWLCPITPEQLLELCPEIVEKYRREGFSEGRKHDPDWSAGKPGVTYYLHKTEQEYINSLNKP